MARCATCDRCGADLLGAETRFHVTMEIAQAYDCMEVTEKDLRSDLRAELERVVQSMENLSPKQMQELEAETFSAFRFDLCADCAAELRKEAQSIYESTHGDGFKRHTN